MIKSLTGFPERTERWLEKNPEQREICQSLLQKRKSCQAPILGGGDFSVSADKKKNTTARGLTKK